MKKLLTRISVAALGLLCALALLEAAIRITAAFRRPPPETRKENVILCLGDSFVYGFGSTSAKTSFPGQLDAMLKRSSRMSAANLGVPGMNTAQVLRQLPLALEKFRPRAVIVLAGANNHWNFEHRREFDGGAIGHLKIGQFCRYLSETLRRGREDSDERLEELLRQQEEGDNRQNLHASEKTLLRQIRQNPRDGLLYSELAMTYAAWNKPDQAISVLKQGMRDAEISRQDIYLNAGRLFQVKWRISHLPEDARQSARYLAEAATEAGKAKDTGTAQVAGYRLASLVRAQKTSDDIAAILAALPPAMRKKDADQLSQELPAGDNRLDAWIRQDIKEIAYICREHSVPLFLANYPDDSSEQPVNKVLRNAAGELGLTLIDNSSLFRERYRKEADFFSKYFIYDGHCNDAGYALMARNAYDTLSASGIK